MSRGLTAFLLLALVGTANGQELRFFTVGSGDVTGGYFSAARALCATVNQSEGGRVRCSPDPSSGSLYNLSMLKKGELDFALVQSDWQRFAYEGTDIFSGDAAMPNLRSVMGLYPETITLLAGAESGVMQTSDLIGKRIDIGPPSSGRFASISRLFTLLDIQSSDFENVFGFTQGRAVDELCANRIDVTVFVVGHPNRNVERAMAECGARLLTFDGPGIAKSLGEGSDYERILIPRRTYPSLTTDVTSYAVVSTVVTRADMDSQTVETFVTRALENLENLSMTSPVLAGLTPEGLRSNGLSAPLHPGAESAYAKADAAN